MSDRKPILTLTRDQFRVDTYRGSGAGGQKRNKTNSAVRITHVPSGASASCEEEREQSQNKRRAFERLHRHPRLLAWIKQRVAEIDRGPIEDFVRKQITDSNLKWEVRDTQGRWIPWTTETPQE